MVGAGISTCKYIYFLCSIMFCVIHQHISDQITNAYDGLCDVNEIGRGCNDACASLCDL